MNHGSRRIMWTFVLMIPLLIGVWAASVPTLHAQGAVEECTYVVVSGDTLGRIARANDTTVAAILEANPQISNPNVIVVGQRIALPNCDDGVVTETPVTETPVSEEENAGADDESSDELIMVPIRPADLAETLWKPIHDATFNIRYPVDAPFVGGTGVMVGLDGRSFLTAFHVVSDWETKADDFDYVSTVEIGPFQNWRYTADVIDTMPIEDLALLRINEADFPGFAVAPLGSSATLDFGDPIYTISYPGYGTEIRTGKGSFLEKYYDWGYESDIIVTDAWATYGSSGGVAVNGDGEVIGIITAGIIGRNAVEYFGYSGVNQLTLIVPIEAAYSMFADNNVLPRRTQALPR